MKSSKQKFIAAVLAAMVIAGVAFGIYQTHAGDEPAAFDAGTAQTVTAATVTQAETATSPAKSDNSGNYEPPAAAPAPAPGALPPDSQLAALSCFVTAEQTGAGNTIAVSFYGQSPGRFTVQQKAANEWQTVADNISYGGSGGIPAATMAPADESVTLRLLKIENGRYTAVSKEFTVTRPEVVSAGGIKTYN